MRVMLRADHRAGKNFVPQPAGLFPSHQLERHPDVLHAPLPQRKRGMHIRVEAVRL